MTARPLFDEAAIRSKVDAGDRGRLWPPASHAGDPDTSRNAETEWSRSGQRETHLRLVIEAVRNWPGLTARGYAARLERDLIEVRRRLSDCHARKLVRQGDPATVGKHKAERTWWPT